MLRMNRVTSYKRHCKGTTRYARLHKRTAKATKNCKHRRPKYSRKKTKRTKHGRKRYFKGGALCPDSGESMDIYDIAEKKVVGASTYFIYEDDKNSELVIKVIPVAKWMKKEQVEQEFQNAIKAGELNIGPKVVYTTFCEIDGKTVGYLVMQHIHGRTLKADDMGNSEIVEQLNNLFEIMNTNDMYMNDLHSNNIMIGKTDEDVTDRVYLIDFSDIDKMKGRPSRKAEDIELI